MITPDALIAQAREWLGVRFLHQGRTRMGCDCLGFIGGMTAELGSTVGLDNLPINYARNPQQLLVDTLNRVTHTIERQPAALVLLQFPHTIAPSHAGIFTGSSLIHCYAGVGRVVEHGYERPWIKRTAGFWALPLVMYE